MIKINCDLGESFGAWTIGLDSKVMPYINQANIACGFHAGDPMVIQQTLTLAKKHSVMVGAHPGYPDLVGFGRRSINCSSAEIISMLSYQISALDGMAKCQSIELQYVKPHGALYNDMISNQSVRTAVMSALAQYYKSLPLMIQATPAFELHRAEAKKFNITLWSEAFADRCYDDDGKLLSRKLAGAIHNKEKMLAQVKQLKQFGTVTTINGKTLTLNPDTLCVHGDNLAAIESIEQIKGIIAS